MPRAAALSSKGVGALIARDGRAVPPLLQGGGQERGRRGGTENVAGIVGFGVACALAEAELEELRRPLDAQRRYEAAAATFDVDLRFREFDTITAGETALRERDVHVVLTPDRELIWPEEPSRVLGAILWNTLGKRSKP